MVNLQVTVFQGDADTLRGRSKEKPASGRGRFSVSRLRPQFIRDLSVVELYEPRIYVEGKRCDFASSNL